MKFSLINFYLAGSFSKRVQKHIRRTINIYWIEDLQRDENEPSFFHIVYKSYFDSKLKFGVGPVVLMKLGMAE